MSASTLTFLEGTIGRRLAKTYTDERVIPYPLAKRFTSHTCEYQDIDELYTHICKAAKDGWCMLKGPLTDQLIEQSRKGKSDKNAATKLLVVDIDGLNCASTGLIVPSFTEADLAALANHVVGLLPPEFRDVSYIAQASSSLGIKPDKVSLHLFFVLDKATDPRQLKSQLTGMNFDVQAFHDQLGLSASGDALSYVIDPTVADNSRIIYIAPPKFMGAQVDPFTDSEDRIIKVSGKHDTLSLLAPYPPAVLTAKVKEKVSALRKAKGLKNKKANTKIVTTATEGSIEVVTNPDEMRLVYLSDEGDYIRYNVNEGDSGAYWVYKTAPEIVYNFKGEPNFLFEKADAETFAWHVDRFCDSSANIAEKLEDDRVDKVPIYFQAKDESKYYYGYYYKHTDSTELFMTTRKEFLLNFCAEEEIPVSEFVPVWEYFFDPRNPQILDLPNQRLNRCQPIRWIRKPGKLDTKYTEAHIGTAYELLKELCPISHTIIDSICGNGVEEFEYFINWLAQVVQIKGKAKTAWVFHGVQGTGKGVFYQHILVPLLGRDLVNMKTIQDLEDRFNRWFSECLLFVIDEFRADGRNRALLNRLKNMITEERGTIRGMHAEQKESTLYANMIFFSNDHDAIKIQEGDRRYNVAPAQQVPLKISAPWLVSTDAIDRKLPGELPALAAFLMHYKVDIYKTIVPLENEAKQAMRVAAEDTIDSFVRAINDGDFDYFAPVLAMEPRLTGEDWVTAAQFTLKAVLREYDDNKDWVFTLGEMLPLFNVLCGRAENRIKFGKMLSHHGLTTERRRKRGRPPEKSVLVNWRINETDLERYKQEYLQDYLSKKFADVKSERKIDIPEHD